MITWLNEYHTELINEEDTIHEDIKCYEETMNAKPTNESFSKLWQ